MKLCGPLKKMRTLYSQPVRYALEIDNTPVFLNTLFNRNVKMAYTGAISCFCGKTVDRVFRQNFCYDCFYSKPEAADFIMRPELSKAHTGMAERDLEWEKAYQLQDHIVYLADSGGLKVGVTRLNQMFTRWMDQGASAAIVLAQTPNRYLAGCIEVALKQHISDKTHVKKMLSGSLFPVDLKAEKERITALIPDDLQGYVSKEHQEVFGFEYPMPAGFMHTKSLSLEPDAPIEGRFIGIRGQYWLFEGGRALNIRNNEGKIVEIDWQ